MNIIITKYLVQVILKLENQLLYFLSKLLFFRGQLESNRCICIHRNGNIGDIVCSVPAIKAIRNYFPKAKLILLSRPAENHSPSALEILGSAKWIDEIWIYDSTSISGIKGKISFRRKIREKKIDLWIELPVDQSVFFQEVKHMLFIRWTGIKWAIGFQVDFIKLFARFLAKGQILQHETDKLMTLLDKEGIISKKVDFEIPVDINDKEYVKKILNRYFSSAKYIVALNPGAKRQANCWPKERYAQIASNLAKRSYTFVAILGSQKEKLVADYIKNETYEHENIVSLAGQLTVIQTLEFIKNCTLLVSNDTGTVHLAAASGVFVIGLYSPWQRPRRWYPYGTKYSIICKEIDCAYCFRRNCSDNLCMKAITVEEVLEKIDEFFATRK